MEDFVNQLVGYLPAPLRAIAAPVVARILAVWHAVTDFWGRVRGGWQRFRAANLALGLSQLRHLYSLAVTLRWFVTVYVPRQASIFANAARAEAAYLIDLAVSGARAELAAASSYLAARIDDAQHILGDWARWTLDHVNSLRDDANRLLGHVFGPLATPQRLAAWAIGAIIDAAIGWLEDNAVRIGQRLVAQRTQIFLSGLSKAEDVVSRIL